MRYATLWKMYAVRAGSMFKRIASLVKYGTSGDPALVQKSHVLPYYSLHSLAPGSFNEFIFTPGGHLHPRKTAEFYGQSSAVAIAVDTIADEVEKIMPVLFDRKTGNYTDMAEILDLLNDPNPVETRIQFFGDLVRDWLLNHDVVTIAVGSNRSSPSAIYSVKAQLVSILQDISTVPSQYQVHIGPITGVFLPEIRSRRILYLDGPLKQLHRIRGYRSIADSIWADSPLKAIALEIRQQLEGKFHNIKLLQNGARLSLVAIFKDSVIDQDALRERRDLLNEQLAGSSNAGKMAVTASNDLDIKEFGTTNKDMDYLNLDTIAFLTIMMRYKIPLPLVSDKSQTFNNFDEAVKQLYHRAVLPAFEYITHGLGQMLLPRFGLEPTRFSITYDPQSIPALVKETIEQLKARKELALETTNELRASLPNREPIGPEGDVIMIGTNLVPLGSDLFTEDNFNRREDRERRDLEESESKPETEDVPKPEPEGE